MKTWSAMFFLVIGLAAPLAAEPKAYVWANLPTAAQYNPDPSYAYNSGGGPITINRPSTGVYTVAFENLVAGTKGGGNVQISDYGGGTTRCRVSGWGQKGTSLFVGARCFALDGTPADAQFTMLVTWPPSPTVAVTATPISDSDKPWCSGKRTIENGQIVLHCTDGRTIQKFGGGGYTITFPDGRPPIKRNSLIAIEAPSALPPVAPGQQTWFDNHADQLLSIIKTLLYNDPQAIAEYMKTEGTPPTVYALVERRRRAIETMVP